MSDPDADRTNAGSAGVPSLVLDTNIVLDWLLFQDASCLLLARSITSGQRRWLASRSMREELTCVLARGIAWRGGLPASDVVAGWDRWAVMVEGIELAPVHALRCTDRDDQKFIDFALQVGASALISRDRAVLKLARRAAAHGLAIVSATDWQPG